MTFDHSIILEHFFLYVTITRKDLYQYVGIFLLFQGHLEKKNLFLIFF